MGKRLLKKKIGEEKCTLGVFGWVIFAVFALYTLILLIPYIYAAFASVSNYKEYYLNIINKRIKLYQSRINNNPNAGKFKFIKARAKTYNINIKELQVPKNSCS